MHPSNVHETEGDEFLGHLFNNLTIAASTLNRGDNRSAIKRLVVKRTA